MSSPNKPPVVGEAPGALADRDTAVKISAPRLLARGYRTYERYDVTVETPDGAPVARTRDVLRGGHVVGVLPFDPDKGELVLIRQFRLAAHLATGLGELVEIVAGGIEPGEQPADAARRECLEEIGVMPERLIELFTFLPTPGLTDERATIFLGVVDAARVPARAGADDEFEETWPFRIAVDAALDELGRATMSSGLLIVALQWLALNRRWIDELRGSNHAEGT